MTSFLGSFATNIEIKGFWTKLDRMDLAENDICCRAKHNATSEESVFFAIYDFLVFETYQVGLYHVWKVPSDPLSGPVLSGSMY